MSSTRNTFGEVVDGLAFQVEAQAFTGDLDGWGRFGCGGSGSFSSLQNGGMAGP